MEIFAERLRTLRKELKLSQKEVALDLGVSQALLSHYERGIRECGLEFLARISDYYGVSSDYILGRSNSKTGSLFLDKDKGFIQIMNAMQIVLDRLIASGDTAVVKEIRGLFEIELSKLLNLVTAFSGDREDMFENDYGITSLLLNTASSKAKTRLLYALKQSDAKLELDREAVSKAYPQTFESLAYIASKGDVAAKDSLKN